MYSKPETYEYLPPYLDEFFSFIGSKFSLKKMRRLYFKHIIKNIERDGVTTIVLLPELDYPEKYWICLYFKDDVLFAFATGMEEYLLPPNQIPPKFIDKTVEILSKCKINDNYH